MAQPQPSPTGDGVAHPCPSGDGAALAIPHASSPTRPTAGPGDGMAGPASAIGRPWWRHGPIHTHGSPQRRCRPDLRARWPTGEQASKMAHRRAPAAALAALASLRGWPEAGQSVHLFRRRRCSATGSGPRPGAPPRGCPTRRWKGTRLPRGGDVVFGVAHQHSGGIGASWNGEDGRLLCEGTRPTAMGWRPGTRWGWCPGTAASAGIRASWPSSTSSSPSTSGSRRPVLQLPGLMVSTVMAIEQPVSHWRRWMPRQQARRPVRQQARGRTPSDPGPKQRGDAPEAGSSEGGGASSWTVLRAAPVSCSSCSLHHAGARTAPWLRGPAMVASGLSHRAKGICGHSHNRLCCRHVAGGRTYTWQKILMVATVERSFLYITKLPISTTYTYEAPQGDAASLIAEDLLKPSRSQVAFPGVSNPAFPHRHRLGPISDRASSVSNGSWMVGRIALYFV